MKDAEQLSQETKVESMLDLKAFHKKAKTDSFRYWTIEDYAAAYRTGNTHIHTLSHTTNQERLHRYLLFLLIFVRSPFLSLFPFVFVFILLFIFLINKYS
jgi:hypothetical protein